MVKKATAKKNAIMKIPSDKGPVDSSSPEKKPRAKKSAATATPKKAATKKAVAKRAVAKRAVAKKAVAKKAVAKVVAGLGAKAEGTTLTATDIGDHLASTFDMPKSHAKIYIDEAVALIGKHLRKGNKVRISGLGVFEVKTIAARKGRDQDADGPTKGKAGKRIAFLPAHDLESKC